MALTSDQVKNLSRLYDRWQSGDATERDAVQREVDAAGADLARSFAQMFAHADTEAAAPLLPPISQAMREAAVLAAGQSSAGSATSAHSTRISSTLSDAGEIPTREPGQHVGPYRLIKELGRGGMGVVWLAERADGQHSRQVALKMPLVENLNWLLAARFARERNILASLEHPSIARLYDAGVDQADRNAQPYIAIEYVQGQPITDYVKEKRLKPEATALLFIRVIEAVAHAHTQLVIHRDIKPSNILVDAKGEPHLLDFGIAKLLDDEDSQSADATQLTRLSGRALTLDYASPEQVNNASLGTASDVYSLGIVLYELLTGSRPYRPKGSTRRDLEQAILDQDPSKPSDQLITANTGDSESGKSARRMRGDLDTVVLKALRKDPKQRYATAQAFADDLKRYLAYEPIAAKPDAGWYRVGRFVRRNRVATVGALILSAVVAVGVASTVWQADRAEREARRAGAEAAQKEVEALRANRAADDAKAQALRADVQASAALVERDRANRAAAQAIASDAQAKQAARAATLGRLEATTQASIAAGESKRANAVSKFLTDIFLTNSVYQSEPGTAQQTRAIDLLNKGAEKLLTGLKDEPQARSQLLQHLSEIYQGLGEYGRAEPLAIERHATSNALGTAKERMQWFESGVTLSSVYYGRGKTTEMLQLTARLLPYADEVKKVNPDSVYGLYVMRGLALINRSDATGLVDLEKGSAGYRTMRHINKELSNNFLHSTRSLATTYARFGRYARADELLAELIEYTKPDIDSNTATVAGLHTARGHALRDAGRFASAVVSYDEAYALRARTKIAQPAIMIALNTGNAQTLAFLGKWQRARDIAAEVLRQTQAANAGGDDLPTRRIGFALARSLSGVRSPECDEMQRVFTETLGTKLNDVLVRAYGAQAAATCAEAPATAAHIAFARELLVKRATHVDLGETTANARVAVPLVVANAMMDLHDGDAPKALARLRAALSRRAGHEHASHSAWLHLLPVYGVAAIQAGELADCSAALQNGLSEIDANAELKQMRPLRATLHYRLAQCSQAAGDLKSARTHAESALALQIEFESPSSENTRATRALLAAMTDR